MLDLDTLDLKRLRAFQLVARQGSLRSAAGRLKLTIPAVSGKLRKLESELGVALFDRLPNKLVLTPAGERFLREADAVIARAEQALTTLSEAAPEGRLTVSVGSDHAWYFAPKIRSFFDRYPSVALSLRVYKSADAIAALDKGEIDVSFGIFPKVPKSLERQVIEETTLSIAYNPRELGPRRRAPGPADLSSQRVMVPPRSTVTRKLIDQTLSGALAKAQTLIEAPTCETAATFVELGVGMALVHSLCMERRRSPDVRTVDLGAKFGTVAFCAVYRRGALRMPLVRALVDQLAGPAR